MIDLAQTSAVVTGASSGIGRAIAVAFAAAGVSRLGIHFRRNLAGAVETVRQVEALGCQATTLQCDLAVSADRIGLVDQAFEQLGPIQTWVNNAGADVLTGKAAAWDFDTKLRRLMEVDLLGTIAVSRMVAERLIQQSASRSPSMVFIGWDQAPAGMEGDAGQMFGTVKAAVMAYAASLAQTLAPDVRVNIVAPGWIQTSWGQAASEYWDHRAKNQSLMGCWGTPADVARAVLYAADPSNAFFTGQTIEINGGWNRRYRDPRN